MVLFGVEGRLMPLTNELAVVLALSPATMLSVTVLPMILLEMFMAVAIPLIWIPVIAPPTDAELLVLVQEPMILF